MESSTARIGNYVNSEIIIKLKNRESCKKTVITVFFLKEGGAIKGLYFQSAYHYSAQKGFMYSVFGIFCLQALT